jgi:hypothetical protein
LYWVSARILDNKGSCRTWCGRRPRRSRVGGARRGGVQRGDAIVARAAVVIAGGDITGVAGINRIANITRIAGFVGVLAAGVAGFVNSPIDGSERDDSSYAGRRGAALETRAADAGQPADRPQRRRLKSGSRSLVKIKGAKSVISGPKSLTWHL